MSSFRGRLPNRGSAQSSATAAPPAVLAGLGDKKTDHDDLKLLDLLRGAAQELQGARLIHLHLSLMRDRDSGAQTLARAIINELSQRASMLQLFSMSNSDVIIIYKGLKLSAITEVCQAIERMFLSRTVLTGPNPYRDTALYSIMELSLNFTAVMRFIEDLVRRRGTVTVEPTKPPITLEELAKVERAIASVDLSPFLLNQPIVNIAENAARNPEYLELYISIKMLQERLCPNHDITANKWLFNYFTANLDQSVLRALGHGLSFVASRRVGININLSSVISTGFIKFDEQLRSDYRGNIVLEIGKGDLIENLTLFYEVLEFAKDKKYQISIDALNPFWVINFDLEYLDVEFAKIFWSPELLEMDDSFRESFQQRIAEQDHCQFILARCDTVSSLMFARDAGIRFVQGRMVDNILRRGMTVRAAILAAEGGLAVGA